MKRFRQLWNVTAVRLSVLYILAFFIVSIIIVIYMTGGAVEFLRSQYQQSINEEIASLQQTYQGSGLNGLIRDMEVRSRTPGANLYVVAAPDGRILAGNVQAVERGVLLERGWIFRPFAYESLFDGRESRAIARIVRLPNGMRILIGKDIGEPERFRTVVRRALTLALGLMMAVSLLMWFFVIRRALRRVDLVSQSTDRILSGDRTERLPVSGNGDEFDRLSRRMNAMLDRISLLDRGLRDVSDSIAHDLKTPLTRLRNKADQALKSVDDPVAQTQAVGEIIQDADQIIKTFNALLMISRVEAGSQIVPLEHVELSEIITDIAELYEPVAEEAGMGFSTDIASSISAKANRELLSQAITNLLDNAMKYGQSPNSGGEIALSLKQENDFIEIAVHDNGPGIPESEFERVTERFYRLDESRNKPGSGLGLALVDAIAKIHEGELILQNIDGGLRASLRLPLPPQ